MVVTTAKWTLDDYHRMIEVGLLEGRQVELLNGEIIEMPPEGPEHAYLGDQTSRYLMGLLGEQASVREGHPITLPNDSEPEPDIAIVRPLGSTYRNHHHPYAEEVFWLIEYANTSLGKDLDAKRKAYAAAGIQEYWIIDLKQRQLILFCEPISGDYRFETSFTTGEVRPLSFPNILVSVRRLLE